MKLAARIVELMREGARGEVWRKSAIASALGVPHGDATDAINSLRYAGKIEWDKLRLAPSMWPQDEPEATEKATAKDCAADRDGAVAAPEIEIGAVEGSPPSATTAPAGASVALHAPAPLQTTSEPTVVAPAEVVAAPASATEARAVETQIQQIATLRMLSEVEAYCARTGTPETRIGEVLYRHPGFIGLVRHRLKTGPDKIAEVCALLAQNPDGLAEVAARASRAQRSAEAAADADRSAKPELIARARPSPPMPAEPHPVKSGTSVAEQVHAEAIAAGVQRRAVKATTTASAARIRMPLREMVEREFLAEPVDALSLLRRRWPDLLDALVRLSRASGRTMAETLKDVIEGGLMLEGYTEEAA